MNYIHPLIPYYPVGLLTETLLLICLCVTKLWLVIDCWRPHWEKEGGSEGGVSRATGMSYLKFRLSMRSQTFPCCHLVQCKDQPSIRYKTPASCWVLWRSHLVELTSESGTSKVANGEITIELEPIIRFGCIGILIENCTFFFQICKVATDQVGYCAYFKVKICVFKLQTFILLS